MFSMGHTHNLFNWTWLLGIIFILEIFCLVAVHCGFCQFALVSQMYDFSDKSPQIPLLIVTVITVTSLITENFSTLPHNQSYGDTLNIIEESWTFV